MECITQLQESGGTGTPLHSSAIALLEKLINLNRLHFHAWNSTFRDSVENKSQSSLIVSLGKALNGMPLHM